MFDKKTTYKELWLFVALVALIEMSHDSEYKKQIILNDYYFGE
jgi:hypothetical protein